MDIWEEALEKHYEWAGKLEIAPRAHVKDRKALSLAYTPGVAQPCLATVSYTHLRAHETGRNLVCRLLLEKKKKKRKDT